MVPGRQGIRCFVGAAISHPAGSLRPLLRYVTSSQRPSSTVHTSSFRHAVPAKEERRMNLQTLPELIP